MLYLMRPLPTSLDLRGIPRFPVAGARSAPQRPALGRSPEAFEEYEMDSTRSTPFSPARPPPQPSLEKVSKNASPGARSLDLLTRLREPAVEVVGGADEREMGERLGKISQMLSAGAQLLPIEPHVVGVAQHFLGQEPRLLEVAGPGNAHDEPEGAHREGPLPALEAVHRRVADLVAVHERVVHQLAFDRPERGEPHGIPRADELEERHEEHRRADFAGALVLDEDLPVAVPEVLHDVFVDGVPDAEPFRHRPRKRTVARDPDRAVERHPAHEARVHEFLPPPADLPDPLVGLLPVARDPVDQADHVAPQAVADRFSVLVIEVHRVHELAVDVELKLAGGSIADPDRPGSPV